jgi:hypothetical protein
LARIEAKYPNSLNEDEIFETLKNWEIKTRLAHSEKKKLFF